MIVLLLVATAQLISCSHLENALNETEPYSYYGCVELDNAVKIPDDFSKSDHEDFIILENGTSVDSRVPRNVIQLVLQHFEAINNGDLATFRNALGASDQQDVYRNMFIVYRYFNELIDLDWEVVDNAVSIGKNFAEVYHIIFEAEFPPQDRSNKLYVQEIRLHPYFGEWLLEVTIINFELKESVYEVQFGYWETGWEIGITNASGWIN